MNHTPEIKSAIQFAARKHHGQFRAEQEPLPYITHLFSVALLLAEGGASDEVVVAGLLHDTLEDTDTAPEELARAFGARVLELVQTVTEPKEGANSEKLAWRQMKELCLTQLSKGTDEALMIAVADKIDNIESKIETFAREGQALLNRFSQEPAAYLWYHGAVLAEAQRRLSGPLLERFARAYEAECAAFSE